MGKAEPLQTEAGTQRQRNGREETERSSESHQRQQHRPRGAGSVRQRGQRKGRGGYSSALGAGPRLGNGINRRLLLLSLGLSVFSNRSVVKMDV